MSNTRKTPKLHEIWEIRHCESVIYSCSFPPKYTSDDANRMWVDLWIFMSRCSSAGFNFKIIDTWGQSLVVVGMGERLLRSLFGFALPSGPNLSSSSWLLKGLEERCWLYCTCTSITGLLRVCYMENSNNQALPVCLGPSVHPSPRLCCGKLEELPQCHPARWGHGARPPCLMLFSAGLEREGTKTGTSVLKPKPCSKRLPVWKSLLLLFIGRLD